MATLTESLIEQYELARECATDCLDGGELLDAALDHFAASKLASALAGAEGADPVWAERAAAHYGQACLARLNHKAALEKEALGRHAEDYRCTKRRQGAGL